MTSTPSSTSDRVAVAAFDFDKTLSTRDCVVPFLRSVVTARRVACSVLDAPRLFAAGVRKERDAVKEIVTQRTCAGVPRTIIEEKAQRFARQVHTSWMRSDTLGKLRWHQANGHRTGIVSASYGVYLRPLSEMLGTDFVIATEMEFDEDGLATGRLLGGNCRGPEKATRLRSWLKDQGLEGSMLYAYGDSAGDKELLEMADHPTLVGKER